MQMVQDNFEGFIKAQITRAIKAYKLQAVKGSPAKAYFEGIVLGKLIEDCPVDVNDLQNAHIIFDPNLADLRGRTVKR